MTMHDLFGQTISSYSRAQAIEDGNLVDVTKEARETGFKWPVAITRAVFEDCVVWGPRDVKRKKGALQDPRGRLHDVLWMAYFAARRGGGSRTTFTMLRVPRDGKGTKPQLVTLELVCGPGDTPEPVVTIQFPGED